MYLSENAYREYSEENLMAYRKSYSKPTDKYDKQNFQRT